MLHHVRLYFTDRNMMYLCNLQNVSKEHLGKHMENHALSTQNVSKEHLGKHMENHALSTEHERKKT